MNQHIIHVIFARISVVTQGVFDSLVTHMESETEDWQLIKKQCQKDGSLPVRIGVITPAEAPELRLCGEIYQDSSEG